MAIQEPTNNFVEKRVLCATLPTSTAAKSKYLFVKYDGTVPAAGTKSFGIEVCDAPIGEQRTAGVIGLFVMRAGAAVSAMAPVSGDSTGRAVAIVSTESVNAIALTAATNADDLILVKLV